MSSLDIISKKTLQVFTHFWWVKIAFLFTNVGENAIFTHFFLMTEKTLCPHADSFGLYATTTQIQNSKGHHLLPQAGHAH